ncbi:MAG: glycine--tRNA ligase subunit beta [Rhodospirillales bacterium]|nr:glycine--tRNA ligase subunit beta [Rhodospirillales bacterium]
MPELLLELLSEEIPARMQLRASQELEGLVRTALEGAGLTGQGSRVFSTPRRLTLVVEGLPLRQADRHQERKGPKVDAPEKAVAGFLRAAGLASIDQAEVRETDKGAVYFAVNEIAGRNTAEVLPDLLAGAIRSLGWPKSMRWGEHVFRWVRPLRSILAVFDGNPLAGGLDLDGNGSDAGFLGFGEQTWGHALHGARPLHVRDFGSYVEALTAAGVMLDRAERMVSIEQQADRLVGAAGLRLRSDPALLDEVVGLVEWPTVLMGRFDEAFLEVPPEVLVTAMRSQQKYFALEQPSGTLAPAFLVVAEGEAPKGSVRRANIVSGNERVLRARLSDARFFWEQDRKILLSDRRQALAEIVFHAKLGHLDRRVARIEELSERLAGDVEGAESDAARQAASLAKTDLVTGMVGEFPELQGLMGRYYALEEGIPASVAEAIAEHYAPRGPDDPCPTAPLSIVVALAEKLDSLVGFWSIGETPTGSKDPYALRRTALGVIRLVLENDLRLPLKDICQEAARGYGPLAAGFDADALLNFFAERLKVALRGAGLRHDLIAAVFALKRPDGGREDDLTRLVRRVKTLQQWLSGDTGENLLIAYRRAANIVRIEEKKDGAAVTGPTDRHLFEQREEQALSMALEAVRPTLDLALVQEDFPTALADLAGLRAPIDAFFDKVTVNVEAPDLRKNRLRLLKGIQSTMDRVALFDIVEG